MNQAAMGCQWNEITSTVRDWMGDAVVHGKSELFGTQSVWNDYLETNDALTSISKGSAITKGMLSKAIRMTEASKHKGPDSNVFTHIKQHWEYLNTLILAIYPDWRLGGPGGHEFSDVECCHLWSYEAYRKEMIKRRKKRQA